MTTPVMTTPVMTTPVMSTPVMTTPVMNHIYIDASYFIFYRVFALCVWWRNAKKDEPLIEPALNDEFLEKFCSTFVDKIKDQPVSALMLHGRTYEQMFTGEINYNVMKEVKNTFNGVVIGNGGINTPEDAKKMIDETGVDGVGLARGIYGKPWLFQQIRDFIQNGTYDYPDIKVIKKIVQDHAKAVYMDKGQHGVIELRKHLCWYFKGFPGANEMRKKFVQVESVDDVKNVLKSM